MYIYFKLYCTFDCIINIDVLITYKYYLFIEQYIYFIKSIGLLTGMSDAMKQVFAIYEANYPEITYTSFVINGFN